ncbi:hypothetical protein QRQ56_39060 [Bradyrhizobium sp. U531]|uniref:hypothetical protein n=1 Tax=Bradyrhizobium sp. U531 TaxID=3053458 RepID=UPI003F41D656
MQFSTLLKLVVLGVALPLCSWRGARLWRSFSSQKASHSTTSTMPSEKKAGTKDSKKKALLEDVESQELFRIAEEDQTRDNDNGAEYRDCNWSQCLIDELNDLIEGSEKISRIIESRVDTMRRLGIGEAHLESDYNALERERYFRETTMAEIDRTLLDIVTKYPEIKMTHIENRASTSNLGESVSLLGSDELLYLQRKHARAIKKARAESAKRALHERRILKRFLASSSRVPRIPESSTTIPESEPHETALLAEVPQANWIQDEEPMETPIEVKAWALTKELILAKSKLIYASCEKSCTLETTRAEMEMRGSPQSELDSVYLEIDKEKQVRQTTFHEMESF